MPNEWNDQDREQESGKQNQQPTGQQGHNEFGQQGQQSQAEREENGQQPFVAPDGQEQASGASGSGQPIGGNDSNTGTGTTLSQGFESSETLTQSGSSQDSLNQNPGGERGVSETGQGGGFIGAEGSGSDDYLQQNPELSSKDSLNQQDDDGMGSAGSEQTDENF